MRGAIHRWAGWPILKKKASLRICFVCLFFSVVLIRFSSTPSAYTSFSCRPYSTSIPYFHTKINISNGVKLWSDACNELRVKQLLLSPKQFTKCDADDKPFIDCRFENVKLEDSASDRLQISERGLSFLDKDGLDFYKLQISAFMKVKSGKTSSNPIIVRNVVDLERQKLPGDRSKVRSQSWPPLSKKFGLVLRSGPLEGCSTVFSEDVVIFYAYHTQNVWHLHEGLFRLWRTIRNNGLQLDDITVIQIDKEGDVWNHEEYLKPFTGVRWLKLIDVPTNSCFQKLHVVGYPQHMFDKIQADIFDVKKYRSFMLNGLNINESVDCHSQKTEITFISRRNRKKGGQPGQKVPNGNRHLQNEDDLIKKISSIENFNARAYSFEALSKREQMKISCKSDILIGVHSGGLLNALWLKPGALLLQTQVPGVEYGNREIWKRPPLLVIQGIGYYDMEQLAKNVGAYFGNIYATGYSGPSKEVANCKFHTNKTEEFIQMCYNVFKKERISFTEGTDFTIDSEILLFEIYKWRKMSPSYVQGLPYMALKS